jgi:hypothetical protein
MTVDRKRVLLVFCEKKEVVQLSDRFVPVQISREEIGKIKRIYNYHDLPTTAIVNRASERADC